MRKEVLCINPLSGIVLPVLVGQLHVQSAINPLGSAYYLNMNSPPGTGPHRPPFSSQPPSFRQLVPAPGSPRTRPAPMLGAQRGIPTPRVHPHHQPRVHQSFPQPHPQPPFMPPMMPFMPYPLPMGIPIPPHVFPRPFPMPLYSRDRIHHVHHHHHHDLHPPPQGSERAFPSHEARRRYDQRSSPQVFDPDGHPVDAWGDGGPEVVDLEEGVVWAGLEMVVRAGYAAGCSTSLPSGITAATSAARRLDANASVHGLDLSHEPQQVEDQSTGTEAAESEKDDSPVVPGNVFEKDDGPAYEDSRNSVRTASPLDITDSERTPADRRVIAQGITDGSAHVADITATAPQSTRSLRGDSSSPLAGLSPQPRRTKSLHIQAIPSASSHSQPRHPIPSSYISLPPNLESTKPSLETPSSIASPNAIDNAVDRLLETTGMSARQFMRMLEDRAFVRDVERYRDAQAESRKG